MWWWFWKLDFIKLCLAVNLLKQTVRISFDVSFAAWVYKDVDFTVFCDAYNFIGDEMGQHGGMKGWLSLLQ